MARGTNHVPGGTPPQGPVHFGTRKGHPCEESSRPYFPQHLLFLPTKKMIRKPFLSVFDDDSHQAILTALK